MSPPSYIAGSEQAALAQQRADGAYPANRIPAIILAGGLSRRLGQPKQTLSFGDGTLLEHAIREAEAVPALDPVVAVLPPGDLVPDPRVERARVTRRAREGGCSASLAAGLETLPHGCAAVMVLPADQPMLTHDAIELALNAWLRDRPSALTLSFRGEPCHPLIFAAELMERLHTLTGEKGMWRLLEELGQAVQRVEIDRSVSFDIDTWDDYRLCVLHTNQDGSLRRLP